MVDFHKSWKIQVFPEIEMFVQKCSCGTQNDGKALKNILFYPHLPIWSNAECLEQKMQKSVFQKKKTVKVKHFGAIFDKSWKIQLFPEIEIFVQKRSRGTQNDGKTLKNLLIY